MYLPRVDKMGIALFFFLSLFLFVLKKKIDAWVIAKIYASFCGDLPTRTSLGFLCASVGNKPMTRRGWRRVLSLFCLCVFPRFPVVGLAFVLV